MFFNKKKDKTEKEVVKMNSNKNITENECITVYTNDFVNLVHDATKLCWAKQPEKTYANKLNYIERRIKTGHESILEHSNIVMLLRVNEKSYEDFMYITQFMKYLNFSLECEHKNFYNVLLSGSIRGYKHLIARYFETYGYLDEYRESQNEFINLIKEELYLYCPREFFIDFIADKHYMQDRFCTIAISPHINDEPLKLKKYGVEVEYDDEFSSYIPSNYDNLDYRNKLDCLNPHCNIINIDDIGYIYKKLCSLGADFVLEDIYKACSVTVFFKDISVSTATQIGRHRNGQTWESKRYINYTDKGFVNPCDYKDEYDKDKKHRIKLKDNISIECTMSELGYMMIDIYSQLLNHGFAKEDARSILPSGVATSLYMTFNYWTLNKFLELRTDKAAQAEVRSYALALQQSFIDYLTDKQKEMKISPLSSFEGYSDIDEDMTDF